MDNKIDIPSAPSKAITCLQSAGFEAGVVGGCVRDAIMGQKPNDWDICTSASPNEICTVFKESRLITTGINHGTIGVIIDGEMLEITTYRIDGNYTDNRRPDHVTFTRNLLEDLSRRDFTMNAVYYNELQGIVDPFDGIKDIKNRTIKTVGQPQKRFTEDALRILRGIRFSSTLGFEIESLTKEAILKYYMLLSKISSERISQELLKLIEGMNAASVINEYKEIITYIIPEAEEMLGFQEGCESLWSHSLKVMEKAQGLELRLAALLHDIGRPYAEDEYEYTGSLIAEKLLRRLKLDNHTINNVVALIKYHGLITGESQGEVAQRLKELTPEGFFQLIELQRAHACVCRLDTIHFDKLRLTAEDIISSGQCYSMKDLAICGRDLIKLGMTPGKQLGAMLDNILGMVIAGQLENERHTLIEYADSLINKGKRGKGK